MTQELLDQLSYDPKSVLNRGFRAMERIAWRQDRINSLKRIALSVTVNPESASSGGCFTESKTERVMLKVLDLENEIADEILEIASFDRDTQEIIDRFVEKVTHKVVLELRYRGQYSWEDIADKLHYTTNWVQSLHQQAINAVKENVKNVLITDLLRYNT